MSVRLAVREDGDEIDRLLRMFHKENGLFAYSPDKVRLLVGAILAGMPEVPGVIGVIDGDVGLAAITIVMIQEPWYSTQRHLGDLVVFVDPDYRKGTTHAPDILRWIKAQSEECGIPLMSAVVSNTRTAAKCRLYGRHFKRAGEFFLHTPKVSSAVTH